MFVFSSKGFVCEYKSNSTGSVVFDCKYTNDKV
jgi:hypothetical protein